MLSFDLSTLESGAVQVDGLLAANDSIWEKDDSRPVKGVRVVGRLSPAGSGRFYFSGNFEGQVDSTCRRCLADTTTPVTEEVHLVFAHGGGDELDDSDVFLIDPRTRELDLREAVREQWLLAVPSFVQCREDCKGLCLNCGSDLNAGPCGCAPVTDSRWDALRTLRGEA